MSKRIWITWETQRRNKELADAFDCEFHQFDFSKSNPLVRFLVSAQKTIAEVYANRNGVVFAQYPSVFLVCLLGFLKYFIKFDLVVDAHNGALEEYHGQGFRKLLSKFALGRSDFVILSNTSLVPLLDPFQSKALILPDKVPEIEEHPAPELTSGFARPWMTLIASYADDEPIEEFLNGFLASKVAEKGTLFVTGRKSRAGELVRYESDQLVFTDFLTEEEFCGLIQKSDLLVDLTTREGCLVCGAYEALAVEVPVLLSNKEALKKTFPSGTIFADNDSESFARGIESFSGNKEQLKLDVSDMQSKFNQTWNGLFEVADQKIKEFAES
jgi:hypothetical protein